MEAEIEMLKLHSIFFFLPEGKLSACILPQCCSVMGRHRSAPAQPHSFYWVASSGCDVEIGEEFTHDSPDDILYRFNFSIWLLRFHGRACIYMDITVILARTAGMEASACFAPRQSAGHFRRPKQARHSTLRKGVVQAPPDEESERPHPSNQVKFRRRFKRIGFVMIRSVVSPNATLDWMHVLLAHFNPRLRSRSYPGSYKLYLLSALVFDHMLEQC